MEKKNELKVKEIQKQYEDAKKAYEELGVQLRLAKQKEEEERKAQLALEKENRRKELDDAIKNTHHLLQEWLKDYGSYGYSNNADKTLFDMLWPSFF
jgi:RNA processing factor Prp31